MKSVVSRQTGDFPVFWNLYGVKRDKIAAERAWKRLSAKDRKAAVAGIEAYREECQKRGISMMYAQGYLNHHRWEDEIESDGNTAKATVPAAETNVLANGNQNDTTDSHKQSFQSMRQDLLAAWKHHRDESGKSELYRLLEQLQLCGVREDLRMVEFRCHGCTFNRTFVVPWYWDVDEFDAIVAKHFGGYGWRVVL